MSEGNEGRSKWRAGFGTGRKDCAMKYIKKDMVINTGKISLAAILASLMALWLGLEYGIAAGIIAILSIQPTKKETLHTAAGRFMAFLAALVISYVCFAIWGFTMMAFGVYLVCFIGVCQLFGWHSSMAMNSVLISHFLASGDMGIHMVINEGLLFLIGVGMGIVANLHLRKDTACMEELRDNTDGQMKQILYRMSQRILTGDMSDYNGDCFLALGAYIDEAKAMARQNYGNQWGQADVFDLEYIRMRERQYGVLQEMYKNIRHMRTAPVTAGKVSEFLRRISEEYHKDNRVSDLLERFHILDEDMKGTPLPTERGEFEDRARLYTLLRQIEEFLTLKKEFAGSHLPRKDS